MIYKMNYDSTRYEECVADSERGVFSSKNNVSNINLNVDYNLVYFYKISNFSYSWENVEFYYDSNVSNNYEDFLFNSLGWTIISERVRSLFCDLNVRGVDFFPVKLIDLAKKMPDKIYYALYINNFIQAYDLENSHANSASTASEFR